MKPRPDSFFSRAFSLSLSRYEEQGKYLQKRNTFFDFVDCARHLAATGWTVAGAEEGGGARASLVSCEGRSAGGLLVGNALNDAPGLWRAALAGVPFVDLMVSMCDASIPLTTGEWEEWGNPNEAAFYDAMRAYSPVDNVRASTAAYPPLLATAGLNDPRVAYWEPTKWTQRLRAAAPDGGADVLLKMDMGAGHFSASDRYKFYRETAYDQAWLLDQHGLAEPIAAAPANPAASSSS